MTADALVNGQVALALHDNGFVIVPCCWPDTTGHCGYKNHNHPETDTGKAPLFSGWQDTKPTIDSIRSTWRRFPLANVGVNIELSNILVGDPDDTEAVEECNRRGILGAVIRQSRMPAFLFRAPTDCPKYPATNKGESGNLDVFTKGQVVVHGRHRLGFEIFLDVPDLSDIALSASPSWLVEIVTKATAEAGPRAARVDTGDEPPVRLGDMQLAAWQGRVVKRGGKIVSNAPDVAVDRSDTLFLIGGDLAKAGASWRTIVDAVAERDTTLGYVKYSERRDGGREEYERIADKVLTERPDVTMSSNGHHPAPAKGPFPLTDLGNAERLVARYGRDLRYCFSSKMWHIWQGKYWKPDETAQIERYAKKTVRAIYDEASSLDDPNERKAVSRHAVKSEANVRLKAMIELATSEAGIPIEASELDAGPWLLNVANGTINLQTGELHEHDRRDLISKIVPISYDPLARLPLWETFLIDSTRGHVELIAFLQRAVGYSLTGDIREEKLFFVHGPSRTGKTTFTDAILMILGDYGTTANFSTFLAQRDEDRPRQDIARLAGARFVLSLEVSEGRHLDEGVVKKVTGGDKTVARFLFGREFQFKPAFKLWLAANSTPKARADDDAIWNRIVRIPFIHVVPPEKRDPLVKLALTSIETAGPALLAWAVKGCLAWQRDGLMIPSEVTASSEGYRLEVDGLADFIDDCCVLEPDAWAWSSVLIDEYERWARANNEKKILRGKSFGARLRARGCSLERREKGNLGASRGWKGIRVLDDGE